MKSIIEYYLNHPAMKGDLNRVIEHMFASVGSGIRLNHLGYFGSDKEEEAFEFPEPRPFNWIYPWIDTESLQPFRSIAGCREYGFEEAAKYFIECIKVTPDYVDNIIDWKKNIEIVEEVLLGTPPVSPRYTDKNDLTKFVKDVKNAKRTIDVLETKENEEKRNSVFKVWFFDVQWSDCPDFVEDEVKNLWDNQELSNDSSLSIHHLDDELFDEYPSIYLWLKYKGVKQDDKVVIHWWW